MYSYGKLEKILHRFALSSQFMREATFDIESSLISSRSSEKSHVFIAGMARSGTTILLNSVYKSNIFASLTYADMPFVLAPNRSEEHPADWRSDVCSSQLLGAKTTGVSA